MSSFQDLYEHVAADRNRAMQFLAIQDIRLKAVKELMDAGIYHEPDAADELTDTERSDRKAEAAYAFGLRSILDSRKQTNPDGTEQYTITVQDTSTKPYSIALCIQTKLEELRLNGAETVCGDSEPTMNIMASNAEYEETIDPLVKALETLRVAYPAWRITLDTQGEEAKIRAMVAESLRESIMKAKKDQTQENVQELAAALVAAPLVFPAQRPAGASASGNGEEHLQFGKARSDDGKSYFLAFTDRASLFKWRRFGCVELYLKDYAPLILNSSDDGLILDPYIGAGMAITREMLKSLLEQYEMLNNMLQSMADLQNVVVQEQEKKEEAHGYRPQKPKVNEWWKK